jgi:hypothetical protein
MDLRNLPCLVSLRQRDWNLPETGEDSVFFTVPAEAGCRVLLSAHGEEVRKGQISTPEKSWNPDGKHCQYKLLS